LLAALPDAELDCYYPHLELVNLTVGQVLCESGSKPMYAYFPITSTISLLNTTQEGGIAEIAMIGNDGVVGISLFLSGVAMPTQAVVQSTGYSYRLPAYVLKNKTSHASSMLSVVLRYAQAVIAQAAQTAICNRFHTIEQQFCRRLLQGLDLQSSNKLMMTQELIANMLGVRREGVTRVAGNLQMDGLIQYYRGQITVMDRSKLEKRVCECYQMVKNVLGSLIPIPYNDFSDHHGFQQYTGIVGQGKIPPLIHHLNS
jgi:CRP-like cAMP-binding protein